MTIIEMYPDNKTDNTMLMCLNEYGAVLCGIEEYMPFYLKNDEGDDRIYLCQIGKDGTFSYYVSCESERGSVPRAS